MLVNRFTGAEHILVPAALASAGAGHEVDVVGQEPLPIAIVDTVAVGERAVWADDEASSVSGQRPGGWVFEEEL
jgi:hypothetical protein